ncbi:MAG: hypothetical protein HQK49_02085 [Oligoflexia bacterium]|nr:hypothetical protein [Oligoflexia bacterium]
MRSIKFIINFTLLSILTILIFILLLLSSCTKKELTHEKLWAMLIEKEPTAILLMPSQQYPAIDCKEYGEGCTYGLTANIRGIILIIVHFKEEKFAKRAAMRFHGFYTHNWLFDNISTEPLLQDFVKEVFKAESPKKISQ